MTVLIDTNVILDFVLKREPFAETARDCMERLIINKTKTWLTASTITDIYYVTKRGLRYNEATRDVIAKLLNAYGIASVDKNDCVNALDLDISDYEDALLSQCAGRVKVNYIITRNEKHFASSTVPAISPEDYLKKYG